MRFMFPSLPLLQFNSKLEEKQLALEAEKAQYEARTKVRSLQ